MTLTTRLMPDVRNLRKINLPQIPPEILGNINHNYGEYSKKWKERPDDQSVYTLSDSFNEEINAWAKEHICDSIYYEFQMITADTDIHKDTEPWMEEKVEYNSGLPHIKFIYLLESGGDNVRTEFFDDDQNLLDSYIIEKHVWYIFNTDRYHRVIGMEPNKTRFAIVGHIF